MMTPGECAEPRRNSVTPPEYVTHYYPAEDKPFLNLSDLGEDEARLVVQTLIARRKSDPRHKRVFGRVYLDYRRKIEEKLCRLFIAAGGRPERQAPHYFVLGDSSWFEGVYPESRSVRLALDALPRDQTSFTYPDSAVAMRVGPEFGLPPDPLQPYHDRVFMLDELAEVVAQYGLPAHDPADGYDDYHRRTFEKYIEVQLWSDAPVRDFLHR
jgi:hypothetical protein